MRVQVHGRKVVHDAHADSWRDGELWHTRCGKEFDKASIQVFFFRNPSVTCKVCRSGMRPDAAGKLGE